MPIPFLLELLKEILPDSSESKTAWLALSPALIFLTTSHHSHFWPIFTGSLSNIVSNLNSQLSLTTPFSLLSPRTFVHCLSSMLLLVLCDLPPLTCSTSHSSVPRSDLAVSALPHLLSYYPTILTIRPSHVSDFTHFPPSP